MNNDNKRNFMKLNMRAMQIFFGIAVFAVITFLFVGQIVAPSESDVRQLDCRIFDADWYQVLDNGERIPFDFPGKVEAEHGEVITLTTNLPDEISRGANLCFRSVWQDVDIYVGDELRRSYNTEDTRPFGENSAFRYLFVELEEEDAGKELIYQFSSKSKYAGKTYTCYIGDNGGIWGYLLKQSFIRTMIAVFLLIMSVCCILICFILKVVYKKKLALNYLSWAIFLCASWMLSEIEFRQTVFSNVSVLTNYTYWTLMLIPIPLILYINEIQNGYYQKVYTVPIIYAATIFIVATVLQIFDIAQFVEMLPFIHGGLLISILDIIVTITIDTVKKRIIEYASVGIGIYGMLVTAIGELVLYYVGASTTLGTVLALGLVFLLVMAIIKTGQDLLSTEQKEQQALAAKEAQAKFLANMSHEIRTPINAVIGMNEMILRESKDEAVRGYAHNIQSASNMLLGLINDVLDFTKIESGQLELVEDTYRLADLIRDELVLLNARVAGKPISTELDINPNLPAKLCGDELRIKQVITNLLSNAVKYTKEGCVTLKIYSTQVEADVINLCFEVKDTGIGIKESDLEHLFDSFKRLELNKNRSVEGTGLGLTITKQLVEQMNGSILVESVYGKGSKFIVSIPQKVIEVQPIGKLDAIMHERREEKEAGKGGFTAPEAKVLVVDDNAMNLTLMKELLKRTKIQVDLAASGKECLEFTKNKKYDLIFMDHMMPELDGVETLQLLRADVNNANVKTVVLALTANASADSEEFYLGYGFDGYFAKPIQTDKLDKLLVQYLPKELVHMERQEVSSDVVREEVCEAVAQVSQEVLYIDRETGLSYCMNSEPFYAQIRGTFCKQARKYQPQLEECFSARNWKEYGIIAHAIKGNAQNIGAVKFSELSLQHELAGKNEDEGFIQAEYVNYVATLESLIEIVEKM